MRSAPSTPRRPWTYTWRDETADRGGSVPQTASTRRSRDTTVFACKSSSASKARCLGAPSASRPSSPTTSTDPRIRNSMLVDLPQVNAKSLLSGRLDGAPVPRDEGATHDSCRRRDLQPDAHHTSARFLALEPARHQLE